MEWSMEMQQAHQIKQAAAGSDHHPQSWPLPGSRSIGTNWAKWAPQAALPQDLLFSVGCLTSDWPPPNPHLLTCSQEGKTLSSQQCHDGEAKQSECQEIRRSPAAQSRCPANMHASRYFFRESEVTQHSKRHEKWVREGLVTHQTRSAGLVHWFFFQNKR